MANATVSRLGLVNNSGTGYEALFLKVFSGEVLTAFSENNIFNDSLHNVRTISSGKSAHLISMLRVLTKAKRHVVTLSHSTLKKSSNPTKNLKTLKLGKSHNYFS